MVVLEMMSYGDGETGVLLVFTAVMETGTSLMAGFETSMGLSGLSGGSTSSTTLFKLSPGSFFRPTPGTTTVLLLLALAKLATAGPVTRLGLWPGNVSPLAGRCSISPWFTWSSSGVDEG